MKKKARVIQISGWKGIVMVLFIGVCLTAGFVAFPAFAAMYGWNYLASLVAIPTINIWQGLLLWGFVAGIVYTLNDRKKFVTSFHAQTELDEEELKKVLDRVRLQSQAKMLNAMMMKATDLKKIEEANLNKNDVNQEEKELVEDINEKRG